jgi:hypothetical protein
MRKVFIVGVGSLVLTGLLVTQSWAGSFSADLSCSFPIKKGLVTITPKGDVTGFIAPLSPFPTPVMTVCAILCDGVPTAADLCIDAPADTKTLKIKAPGLGAALGGTCIAPVVSVGGACTSAYSPPAP